MCIYKKILLFGNLIVSPDSIVEKKEKHIYIYMFHFSRNWLNLQFDRGNGEGRGGGEGKRGGKEMGLCEDATNERIEEQSGSRWKAS